MRGAIQVLTWTGLSLIGNDLVFSGTFSADVGIIVKS